MRFVDRDTLSDAFAVCIQEENEKKALKEPSDTEPASAERYIPSPIQTFSSHLAKAVYSLSSKREVSETHQRCVCKLVIRFTTCCLS